MSTTRHVFMTKARPGKMDAYVAMHDRIYPEVCKGLRASGISSLEILRKEETLVMVGDQSLVTLSLDSYKLQHNNDRLSRRTETSIWQKLRVQSQSIVRIQDVRSGKI